MTDFYGDKPKMFIGVVKDIQDPWNSNMVRVRIKGIHPEGGDDASVTPGGSSGGSSGSSGGGSTGSGGGSSGSSGSSGTGGTATPGSAGNASPAIGKIDVKKEGLPTSAQLDGKISQLYTLRQLTVGASGSQSKASCSRGIAQGLLTADIIYNLANLATNALDPMKTHFQNLNINSGWRLHVSKADNSASGGNHPKGYAADISAPGVSPRELANYAQSNLKGRFNMLLVYPTFIHIQLGGSSRQGTTSSPYVAAGKP
jgi:hypothetical protein